MKNALSLFLWCIPLFVYTQPNFEVVNGTAPVVNNGNLQFSITFTNNGNSSSPPTEAIAYLSDVNDDDLLDYFSPFYFDYPICFNTQPLNVPSLNPGQTYTAQFNINVCDHTSSISFGNYSGVGAVIDWENLILESNDIFDNNSGYFPNTFNFNNVNCPCPLPSQCLPGIVYCPTIYDPVCGCNNVTYNNDCNARLNGIYEYTTGECGCNDEDIECGETISLSNFSSGNNHFSAPGCTSNNLNSNDIIIRFERQYSWMTNWITLYNPGNINLNLYLYDECPTGGGEVNPFCIASSQNSINCNHNFDAIEVSGFSAGTYYIVIDGFSSGSLSSNIELSLSCESLDCSDAENIFCNQPLQRSNTGYYNNLSAYYSCYSQGNGCYNYQGSWYGGERIFKFTAPDDGDYTFCMDPSGNIDLELFLFNACCSTQYDPLNDLEVITDFTCFDNCDKAATRPAGQTETIENYSMQSGDMVWLIVDGFLGDEGSFTIEVKCNTFNCNDAFNVTCNTNPFDDSNSPTSNQAANTMTTDIFDNHNTCVNKTDGCTLGNLSSSSEFEEPEVVYHLDDSSINNKDVVIDIFPRISNLDVDLFVYEDCDFGDLTDCDFTSTWGPNEDDSVIIKDNSASDEYYIVVDGQSNSNNVNRGRYGFSITCGHISDHTPTLIQCGDILFGDTRNSNNYLSHYCNCPEDTDRTGGGNNGNEIIYEFEIDTNSDIRITLDQFGTQNLELYLLDAYNIDACYANSRNRTNNEEVIETNLNPGTYYIIVEGHDGDNGEFRLQLEGCSDLCAVRDNVYCEDFESYNANQAINLQSNQWRLNAQSTIEPDCKVGSNSNNKFLLVEDDSNGSHCNSVFNINDNTNRDIIELTFEITMSYYNSGVNLLQADGAEITIFETDESSQDFIYLAFRPYSNGSNDDRRICLNINNVYESIGCSNGDGELFPFNRNSSNLVSIILKKSTQEVSVSINDELIAKVQQSGVSSLGMASFRSAFNPNKGFEVDNICLNTCRNCPGDVFYLVDEEGNPPCDNILIANTSQSDNNNNSISFEPGDIVESEFIRWEIRDAQTESVLQTDSNNSQNYSYCCFTPGRSYYICYYYKDLNDCIQFCCIRVDIPNNCNFIQALYSGTESNLQYNLTTDQLTTSQNVVAWFDGSNGNLLGQNQNVSYNPTSLGTRYICCLIYDSFSRSYILCCRTICIENPFSCNNFTITPNDSNTNYTLSAPTTSSEITWFLDEPISAVIGFNNPQTFSPTQFNISPNESFQVSYRYRDASGCWRFCCRTVMPTTPVDPLRIELGEACGNLNDIVDIPIFVYNFNDVNAATFSINLDNTFGTINNITLDALPGMPLLNPFTPQQMAVVWINTSGVDLQDGTQLGNIEVAINGNNFDKSKISITNMPAEIAFTNSNSQLIPIVTTEGEVCLGAELNIEGTVYQSNNVPISNANVNISGGQVETKTTNSQGKYSFNVQPNQNYTINVKKDGDDRNGVSIVDLLKLQRHLVFIERFENPYQWIASDLNNDNMVSIVDLLLLQQLLVFITPEFELVDSWKFIDVNHTFPNQNPLTLAYPNQVEFTPLTQSVVDVNFVGVKMGDVDNSALLNNTNIIKKQNCWSVNVKDKTIKESEIIDITFEADSTVNIAALIHEISFDVEALEYMEFVSSDLQNMTENNVSSSIIDQGYLILNWVSPTGAGFDFEKGSGLYTLRFKSLKSLKLSEVVKISNDNLESTFVDGNVNSNCTTINFEMTTSITNFSTQHQKTKIYPVPSSGHLFVDIYSKQNETLVSTITDLSGRKTSNALYKLNAGKNTLDCSAQSQNLNEGVYFINLSSKSFSTTQKIMIIN